MEKIPKEICPKCKGHIKITKTHYIETPNGPTGGHWALFVVDCEDCVLGLVEPPKDTRFL